MLHVAAEQKIPADILKDIIQKTNDVNRSNYPGEAPIHKLVHLIHMHAHAAFTSKKNI